jgi:hypothetical protein
MVPDSSGVHPVVVVAEGEPFCYPSGVLEEKLILLALILPHTTSLNTIAT